MTVNQVLYNGLLSAGLIWSLLISDPIWSVNIATCFLIFVAIAGIYGAITASRKIIYVQTVPAVLALASLHLI